ncbi:hypothetical protein [Rubritalea marina]|uniref:hypothetical protein n=1 Tax=Rubritalea marina TaxID=361055 RepID=UPI000370BBAC|nr:hypothetical protein [Rubritalea marina]
MQRSRLLLLLSVISLSLCAASADEVLGLRAWTNQKGQSLQASFVKIRTEQKDGKNTAMVTFKKARGREVTFEAKLLSDEHQLELAEWLDNNPHGTAPPTPPYSWPSQYRGKNTPKAEYIKYDDNYKAHLYRTKHFDFFVDAKISDATVSKCVAVFDSIVEAINSLPLAMDTIPHGDKPRFEAILVSTHKKYKDMGGQPNSAGFFSPRRNLTVIPFRSLGIVKKNNNWVFDGKNRDFSVLIHELTHHATSHWIGMPPWFHEGFAEYMSQMPYRSGTFLFTNPGRAVANKVKKANFRPPNYVLNLSYPEWNRSLRYHHYASSMLLVYYFMHVDGSGNGEHFIQWMHAWRSAFLAKRNDEYADLLEEHLLRGRSIDELGKEISAAMMKKGSKIGYSSSRQSPEHLLGLRRPNESRTSSKSSNFPF